MLVVSFLNALKILSTQTCLLDSTILLLLFQILNDKSIFELNQINKKCKASQVLYCIVLYCIVLYCIVLSPLQLLLRYYSSHNDDNPISPTLSKNHNDDDVDIDKQIHNNTSTRMVRIVTIQAPFCLRKDANDASTGSRFDTRDGFFIADKGILVFRDDTMMVNIYEQEAFRTNGLNSIPVLQINLQTVASIQFRKIISTSSRPYEGGTMIITGRFDREKDEIVTIKMMNRDDYKLLVTLLREVGM